MSWYDEDFAKRAAISIVNTVPDDPIDVAITIPQDWDEFWTTIDTSAAELRVVDADGTTLLAYAIDDGSGGAFSRPNRLGRIRIDTLQAPTLAGVSLAWLYFDSAGAASAAVSVTITSAKTGHIEVARPSYAVVAAVPPRVGSGEPRGSVPKDSGESIHVWLDVSPLLERRTALDQGAEDYEEVWVAAPAGYDDTGASAASLVTLSKTRFVEVDADGRRRMFVRCYVTAGTNGDNYTVRALMQTVRPAGTEPARILSPAFGVRVRDLLEPAP